MNGRTARCRCGGIAVGGDDCYICPKCDAHFIPAIRMTKEPHLGLELRHPTFPHNSQVLWVVTAGPEVMVGQLIVPPALVGVFSSVQAVDKELPSLGESVRNDTLEGEAGEWLWTGWTRTGRQARYTMVEVLRDEVWRPI